MSDTANTITDLANKANAAIDAARMAPSNWADVDWRRAKVTCLAVARAARAAGQPGKAKAWRAQANDITSRLRRAR